MNRNQLRDELPEPVRRYFEEEVAHMEPPDDLMDMTIAEVESQPRVNRFSFLPAFAALAGAAAVVLAIVIGANLFNGGPFVGTSSESPSASPSASSGPKGYQPWNLAKVPTDTDLTAGAYYLDDPALPARINLRVPDGWWKYTAARDVQAVLVKSEGTTDRHSSAWGLAFSPVGRVREDPCDSGKTLDPSVTKSAAALVAAFKSWPGYTVHAEDVLIRGYSGMRVTVQSKEPMSCTPVLFTSPAGYDWDIIETSGADGNEPSQMTLINMDSFISGDSSGVLAIWTTDFPETTSFEVESGASPDPQAHAQDQEALHAILDSIRISPH
jgi:hypothetical protein